ncbi:hypothetical protein L209DRAFT_745969 [Thermothelomyces heterothallicus CBS 203.75]
MSPADNGGIRVRRDTTVTVECGQASNPDRSSPVTTTVESSSASLQESERPRSLPVRAGPSDFFTKVLRSDSLSQRRRKKRNDVPPGGPMSVPDALEEQCPRSHKRFSFWSLRRKKGYRPNNESKKGLMAMPDSAVAATTIGGHRHIAISMPTEDMHPRPPAHCEPKVPPASLPDEPLREDAGRDELAFSPAQSRDHMRSVAGDTECSSPLYLETRVAEKVEDHAHGEDYAQLQAVYSPVGLHNANSVSLPDLTELHKGLRHMGTALTDLWGSRRQSVSATARRSTDLPLLQRPASPDSFYTATSGFGTWDIVAYEARKFQEQQRLGIDVCV